MFFSAYVCGEKEGLMLEKPYYMGETLNGTLGLDIEAEKKVMDEKLKQLKAENASEKSITTAMKELGLERCAFIVNLLLNNRIINDFFLFNIVIYQRPIL